MPRGENLSAVFRKGTGTRYIRRPKANRRAARAAWDSFARAVEDHNIEWLQLLDGYWGCQVRRPDGGTTILEKQTVHFRNGGE